jgi:hypothetical protein
VTVPTTVGVRGVIAVLTTNAGGVGYLRPEGAVAGGGKVPEVPPPPPPHAARKDARSSVNRLIRRRITVVLMVCMVIP